MSFVKPIQGITFSADRMGYFYALSRRESGSNLNLPDTHPINITAQAIPNQAGYIGYFQCGEAALYDAGYFTVPYPFSTDRHSPFQKALGKNDWVGTWTGKNGVRSKNQFLTGRRHQLDAIGILLQNHCQSLRNKSINEFYGKIVQGIEITESGCCAGAHLVGAKHVLRFVLGKGNKTDGNGTPISHYIDLFAHYDLESCCNRKIYIQVKKDNQPASGKKVLVESEYDGKFHVGKLTNTYTTNEEGKIPVIVRHPGAKIKITVEGKSTTITQEADKKQSYVIDLTNSISVTAPLEQPSTPQPKPKPNQTPQEARNEQQTQSTSPNSAPKDVNFNIKIVEADTKRPITSLKFFVTYKGRTKDKRTDQSGVVKGVVASAGQDIEISMQGDKSLQPISHFKVDESLEGKNVEVLLPVHTFSLKVVNHKSEPVKNTNFIIQYRGRSIAKKTDSNGNISTRMLVGFVYKFCLPNGQVLTTSRCLKSASVIAITMNEVAYNLSQGRPAQASSTVDRVFSYIKDKMPSLSLSPPKSVKKPSPPTNHDQPSRPSTPTPRANATPPPVKQNNTHTQNRGNPLTVVTNTTLASDTVRYHIYHTGEIKRENGKATGFAEFIYYDKNGGKHNLGKSALIPAPRRAAGNGIIKGTVYLVDQRKHTQYKKDNISYKWRIISSNNRFYLNGVTMAAVLGALMTYNNEEFIGSGFSNSKGESVGGSKTHRNGEAGDFRYLATDKTHKDHSIHTYYKNFDMNANTRLVNLFKKFGFTDILTATGPASGVPKIAGTRYVKNHHDHVHIGEHNYVVTEI